MGTILLRIYSRSFQSSPPVKEGVILFRETDSREKGSILPPVKEGVIGIIIPAKFFQGGFNPLPPVKEGVISHARTLLLRIWRFNPLPPVKEGVIGDTSG